MKTARQLAIAILVFISAFGLYFGTRMLIDPSGNSLGLPFYLLNGTMFKDYIIPGWTLLVGLGVLGLFTVIVTFKKTGWYPVMILVQGLVVVAIVIAQMILLGNDYFLQYFFLMIGFFIVALGFLLGQMKKTEATKNNHNNGHKKQNNHY